jgi:queuosine precursor transporter
MTRTRTLVGLYLLAIVAANLAVAMFGPAVVIVSALLLIAFDLTSRDALHEAWHGQHLRRNMALLIASGSILSAVLDLAALPVAVASFCAFALSESVDTMVYSRLEARGWMMKVNGSNVVSALVDSMVFLSLLAVLGGLPWSVALRSHRQARAARGDA